MEIDMRFGITERGDAGLDFSWYDKLSSCDMATLITKNLSDAFIDKAMKAYNESKTPIIIHADCTGWGHTWLEPCVPAPDNQLAQLKKLIDMGFPTDHLVLRIDPLIPTIEGFERAQYVLDEAAKIINPKIMRVRISVLDEYKHVKQRLRMMGRPSFYPENDFSATHEQFTNVFEFCRANSRQYGYVFETCAEKFLPECGYIRHIGCISQKDLEICGIDLNENSPKVNPQNRFGCLCLHGKTELLSPKKNRRCAHQCIYCYWKDPQ